MAGVGNTAQVVNTTGGLLSFEKELICSICTEVLYTPLTILNCLHTFCGSCLKEWFYHQHRKASSSRSSSAIGNPYSCPTCRSEVRDVQHNATVSNLLELFLAANPDRDRSPQDKEEMDQMYKPDGTRPGDKLLLKVERKRERRHRRDEPDAAARERQMIEEARQRSLRDFEQSSTTNNLAPPPPRSRDLSAGSAGGDRDREERRQRRRERERQREQTTLAIPGPSHNANFQEEEADRVDSALPVSSPRHPDAVEARQREQRMSHQASLRSLVSASESGTGTGDSLDEARIMQEILDEGLLGEIDVDSLTEAEQDLLAERIAELYRQRHPRTGRRPNAPASTRSPPFATTDLRQDSTYLAPDLIRRPSSRSRSANNEATTPEPDNRNRSHSSRPPQAPVNTMMRSNSSSSVTINHRRRTSDQSRNAQRANGSRHSSTERHHAPSEPPRAREHRPSIPAERTNTDPTSSPRASEVWLQTGADERRFQSRTDTPPMPSPRHAQTMPIASNPTEAVRSPRLSQAYVAELDSTTASVGPAVSTQFNEPSVSCFRCEKVDIQYEIFKHCQSCDVDLCMQCYREGRGCKHWYGFGHVAEDNFEISKTRDHTTEPPHLLIGRQYLQPSEDTILNMRTSARNQATIPSATKSDPTRRLQEGNFCDRCGTFANSQFWLCDICNDGEWGYCKSCVQAHHCCIHPLLPVAYIPQSQAQAQQSLSQDLATLNLRSQPPQSLAPPRSVGLGAPVPGTSNSSRPITPTSTTSSAGRPRSHPGYGYDYLSINVNCDMCHNIIFPAAPRHHCPFHASDYDICTSCYASYLATIRMRRDRDAIRNAEITAGWRKCPLGHRMIVLAFEADDEDGAMRRVVKNDLVGGWKMDEDEIKAWNLQHNLSSPTASPPTSPPLTTRGTWIWKENADGTRRTRTRSSTLTNATPAVASSSYSNTNATRFPPDGGFGVKGTAFYPYWPEDAEAGEASVRELALPRGAAVAQMEDINGDWWGGVYAGDFGIFPAGYVREIP